MATNVSATFLLDINVVEKETSVGIGSRASKLVHPFLLDSSMGNGTGANNVDAVYSAAATLAATTLAIDLRGGLNSVLTGDAVAFPIITTFAIKNKATTTGYNLTIGAGSNPFITWLGATGDAVKIGPGGVLIVHSPVDGYATTAGTADILQLDSGANSVDYEILILGRASN